MAPERCEPISWPGAWHKCRSLGDIPDLSERERMILKEQLHELIPKYLDTQVRWTLQDPQATKKIIREIVKACPFLARYDKAWPVHGYIRTLIPTKRVSKSCQIIQPPKISLGMKPTRAGSDRDRGYLQEYDPRGATDQIAPTTDCSASDGLSLCTPHAVSTSIPPGQHRTFTKKLGNGAQTALPTFSPLEKATSITGAASNPEAEPIKAFLRSLNPSMEHLTSVFIEGGILTKHCLTSLAALPHLWQDRLLRYDLQLNAFQAVVVKAALKNLKGSPPASDSTKLV